MTRVGSRYAGSPRLLVAKEGAKGRKSAGVHDATSSL